MLNPETDVEKAAGRKGIPHWRLIAEQGVVTPEIQNHKYEGSGTEEDPYIVMWIEHDPRNPITWTKGKRWAITVTVAFATLAVSFCSSAYSGGIRQLLEEFQSSQEVVTLGLSLFVLGFAIGPLLWAPLSVSDPEESVSIWTSLIQLRNFTADKLYL
jgi:hypothetical protein